MMVCDGGTTVCDCGTMFCDGGGVTPATIGTGSVTEAFRLGRGIGMAVAEGCCVTFVLWTIAGSGVGCSTGIEGSTVVAEGLGSGVAVSTVGCGVGCGVGRGVCDADGCDATLAFRWAGGAEVAPAAARRTGAFGANFFPDLSVVTSGQRPIPLTRRNDRKTHQATY